MTWFSRLFGGAAAEGQPRPTTALHPVVLRGDGKYAFDVVGESRYQEALTSICGGKSEENACHQCLATLIPEPENPYDANAIAVIIEQKVVGYLSRPNATRYRQDLAAAGHGDAVATCNARIIGGWDRGDGDEGSFGVKLDLRFPILPV